MKNECSVCDELEMIVVGTYMWILGEEIIEEDKWDNCPICKGSVNDDAIG
jgi:hypothetical protein